MAGRIRRVLLWTLFVAGFAVLVLYHGILTAAQQAPTFGTRLGADLLAATVFGLLGLLIARMVRSQSPHPSRMLWLPLVCGVLGVLVTTLFVVVTGGPAGIDDSAAIAADFRSVMQISGIASIEVAIAFLLLFSLQSLVLFRRTPASGRNWYLMVGLMAAAATVLAGQSALADEGTYVPHIVLLVATMPFMVANSFRLSWIVYLPFRQKLKAMGLTLGLVVLLVVLLTSRADGGWMGATLLPGGRSADLDLALVAVFSSPLNKFVELVLAFGILYGTTALLALLFHLPTARAMQQKSGEMEALQALARLSSDVFDRERLVNTIAGAPVEAGVAEAAWLALIDPERGSLRPHLVAARGLAPLQIRTMTDSDTLADEVIRTGLSLVLSQATVDHRVRARPGDGIGSLVVLPLRAHDEIVGVLFAARAIPHGFERDDVAALETFASQAALSISSARLISERLEHERASRELAIARDVQRRLLPESLPCTERLNCSVLSLPAFEVAGDYYDVIDLSDGRAGFIVADVAGKGTSAAFHMAELRGVFQSVGRISPEPAALLNRANEALAASLYRSAFITAIYAVIDEASGDVVLARAGHCPAILATEGGAHLIRPGGIGIGLDSGPLFKSALEEMRLTLEPGDSLLLYTDGLVEARSSDGEEYGYERLIDAVARHRHLDPDSLRDAVVAEVEQFAVAAKGGPPGIDDDLTLVVMKWRGAATVPTSASSPAVTSPEPIPA
jgi:phosphoserine phosphatase RsbU/P